jgi:uncharacterized protein YbjT (DUF2867 family)
MKTALIIGATGLVGKYLAELLLNDSRFGKVIVFARRTTGLNDPKLEEHIVDFNSPAEWMHLVKGDVAFSAMGTTLKQAGSKEAQYKIDYTYQYEFAKASAANGVPVYVLVSSAGADAKSTIFYSRIKGELENAVRKLNFTSVYFIQPSLLVGDREEKRGGEKIGFAVLKALNAIGILRKYKPIHGREVAKALLNCGAKAEKGVHTITLNKVFEAAGI